MRNEVIFQIRKAKNEEIDKLKNKFKDPNICQKDWWKPLKTFIKSDQVSSIPLLKVTALSTVTNKKRHLDSNQNASPKFFFDGKRPGQIYHARLRMRSSSLNAHLFSKNIIDSPLCTCGVFEDTHHFLLSRTRYTILRQELIKSKRFEVN